MRCDARGTAAAVEPRESATGAGTGREDAAAFGRSAGGDAVNRDDRIDDPLLMRLAHLTREEPTAANSNRVREKCSRVLGRRASYVPNGGGDRVGRTDPTAL